MVVVQVIPQTHTYEIPRGIQSQMHIFNFFKRKIDQALPNNAKLYIFSESGCNAAQMRFMHNPNEFLGRLGDRFREELLAPLNIHRYNVERGHPINIQFINVPCFNKENLVGHKIINSVLKYTRKIQEIIKSYKLDRLGVHLKYNQDKKLTDYMQTRKKKRMPELDEIFFMDPNQMFKDATPDILFLHDLNYYKYDIGDMLQHKFNYEYPYYMNKQKRKVFEETLWNELMKSPTVTGREYLTIVEMIEYVNKIRVKVQDEFFLLFGEGHDFTIWNDLIQESPIQFKEVLVHEKEIIPLTTPRPLDHVRRSLKVDLIKQTRAWKNKQLITIRVPHFQQYLHLFNNPNLTYVVFYDPMMGIEKITPNGFRVRYIPLLTPTQDQLYNRKVDVSMVRYRNEILKVIEDYGLNENIKTIGLDEFFQREYFNDSHYDVKLMMDLSKHKYKVRDMIMSKKIYQYPSNFKIEFQIKFEKDLMNAILKTVTINSYEYMVIQRIQRYIEKYVRNNVDEFAFILLTAPSYNFKLWQPFTILNYYFNFHYDDDFYDIHVDMQDFPFYYYPMEESRRASIVEFLENLD
jgi:hypothetical protein